MSTSRPRAPLASIPNATNSPHRAIIQSTKRPRPSANIQQENEPPQKRQMVERDAAAASLGPITPRRKIPPSTAEGRVFERGTANAQPTAFQRKLVAARDRGTNLKITKSVEAPTVQNVENIRQWQKHYRKAFPEYTFFFESVPEDLKARFSQHIASLGAHEEKFFSKAVTHIVTTRSIPPEQGAPPDSTSTTSTDLSNEDTQLRTINPTLLEKTSGLPTSTRAQTGAQHGQNVRRDGPVNLDILSRGRQMGMKIWAAEKLHRILTHIFDESVTHGHNTRGNNNISVTTVRGQEEDLSQVLRNEKLNGPADRDPSAFIKDLVLFKGPFIYIHDMDAKYRPTMVREYPKVARRQDGAWPQFRSAAVGKCPFVEDHLSKRDAEREREREKALAQQLQREAQQAPRTRSIAAVEAVAIDQPRRTSPRKALREVSNVPTVPNQNKVPPAFSKPSVPMKPERQSSFPPAMVVEPSAGFIRPAHMHFSGEPAASGIQHSNLTSAIRSQMISSTAAAPGAKAGTSREVHELKRKVLERSNTGSLSVGSMPSSHRMTDLAGALKNARAPAPQRAAKSRAQEKLGGIQEDASDDELAAERAAHALSRKNRTAKKDPKPGYCENCRDKYDDFDEHIVSRKHRKFAMTQSNWTELDELLRKLQSS